MNINVDNLNSGFSKDVHIEGEVLLPKSLDYDEEAFIKGKGTISNSYGKYTFIGNILAEIKMNCSSCLEGFKQEICFDMIEVFSKDEIDEEIWPFSSKDNIIHLDKPIVANVLLNLPMKALCSQNCKGLCRICGYNLNEGDCGCDRGFIDPRFEKFLNVFENKEV